MYDDRKTNRSRIPLVDSLSNNSGGWLRHKEKMSFREYISVTISVAVLIIFSITLGYKAAPEIESIMNKIQNNYGDSPEECTNLSLRDTAYCLNNYVSSIYKYEVTQDRTKLSLEELKEKGGDCKNWAELYYDYGSELGFYVKRPVVITEKGESAHTFTIISDETGYCILDMLMVKCVGLSDE